MGESSDPRPPFALDEYAEASMRFFSDAVRAISRASSPILGQVPVETVEVIPPSVNTLDAVKKAKQTYSDVNGCFHCAIACHTT